MPTSRCLLWIHYLASLDGGPDTVTWNKPFPPKAVCGQCFYHSNGKRTRSLWVWLREVFSTRLIEMLRPTSVVRPSPCIRCGPVLEWIIPRMLAEHLSIPICLLIDWGCNLTRYLKLLPFWLPLHNRLPVILSLAPWLHLNRLLPLPATAMPQLRARFSSSSLPGRSLLKIRLPQAPALLLP